MRIIQRFGRIVRIGSQNAVIQLVNFWPDLDLDEYINLKSRVETRMRISVMASTWIHESDATLTANGFSLDEIWNGFIAQIALYEDRTEFVESMTIDERLTLQERIVKLEKLIEKTEAFAWKEQPPKKR